MPGVPGKGGPVPKRSDQRLGHHSPDEKPVEKVPVTGSVPVPPPDPTWHAIAADWYNSLSDSGQAKFFEPSDWQVARWCAWTMTGVLNDGELNGSVLGQIRGLMTDLLCTESARRRVQIEVERAKAEVLPPEVPSLDDYRTRLAT